jgi:hypothetical protein
MAGVRGEQLSPADVEANVALDVSLWNAVAVVNDEFVPDASRPLGNGRPLIWVDGGGLKCEVAVGDRAQVPSIGELAGHGGPFRSVGSSGVEVSFESVRGVTPDGATRPCPRRGTEEFDLPRFGPVHSVKHASESRQFEAVGDDTEVDEELAPLRCGGIEGPTAFLLMGVEGFESSPGIVLRLVGRVDPAAGLLEAVGGPADSFGGSSRPSLPRKPIVFGGGFCQFVLG